MPPRTVYVGRPGKFGNPFYVGQDGTHAECVELHRRWLTGELWDSEIRRIFIQPTADWLINMRHVTLGAILRELPGKDLACWCAPSAPCHADTLLEFATERAAFLDHIKARVANVDLVRSV